jgi:hypothetical protein
VKAASNANRFSAIPRFADNFNVGFQGKAHEETFANATLVIYKEYSNWVHVSSVLPGPEYS